MIRDALQELVELGVRGTAFRIYWEVKTRGGSASARTTQLPPSIAGDKKSWATRLPFTDGRAVADYMRAVLDRSTLNELREEAKCGQRGMIRAFGRWYADYGDPIEWHKNPVTGELWESGKFWSRALVDEPRVGDVKLTWEIARFPHFYRMARAAAFFPPEADELGAAVWRQIEGFEASNPFEHGIHWSSGQEIAIRLMAWLFALDTVLKNDRTWESRAERMAGSMRLAVNFIKSHIDYARIAVYNNHILGEALALYAYGLLFASEAGGREGRDAGKRILNEEVARQFYPDGGYIQLSHNYHRVALQYLLLAGVFARHNADAPSPDWVVAMERSLEFLLAHQNPDDGRLPNYGSNDGALALPLTSCDFSDFRPVLQAVSIFTRGERLYDRGPWDEEAAWLLGPVAVDQSPLRRRASTSVSFMPTGFHVLRASEPNTFASFRCGTIRDRFSQIDMLHVDLWWHGENVLVDGGSYLYNGPEEWHEYFFRTASHNTVVVDGVDQMLHYRRFKVLYLTRARLLAFEQRGASFVAAGEHYGYERLRQAVIHRRSVALTDDETVVVLDTITGTGSHDANLYWLGGPYPYDFSRDDCRLTLRTPAGPFVVSVYRGGSPAEGDVVAGQESPPRGWLSRYYGEKVAVPSLLCTARGAVPLQFLSVLGPQCRSVVEAGNGYAITTDRAVYRVPVDAGIIQDIVIEPAQ